MLYRYRKFDEAGYALLGLKQSSLWCSNRGAFNDPFEFQFELERHPADIDVLYDFWLETYPHWQGQLARKAVPLMALEILSDYIDKIGVCCFSTERNNVQMWSYYANGHSGFCLGFDFPMKAKPGTICQQEIYEVKYTDECPRFPLSIFMNRPIPLFDAALPFLTTKHTNWQHEREWRYLHNASNAAAEYPMAALQEIIVGAKTTRANVDALREVCNQLGLNVRFLEALVVPRSYEMILRDL